MLFRLRNVIFLSAVVNTPISTAASKCGQFLVAVGFANLARKSNSCIVSCVSFYILNVILQKESKDLKKANNSRRKSFCAFIMQQKSNTPSASGARHKLPRQTRTAVSSARSISPTQRPLSDNIHTRQTSMYPAGFEPTIQGSERPQIHAFDRAATRFAIHDTYRIIIDLSRLISYRMFLFGRSEKLCSILSVIAMRLAKLQGC